MSNPGEKFDGRRYFIEGAMVPASLTALAFVAGLGLAFNENPGIEIPEAIHNAWVIVRLGLIISLGVTGTSLYAFLFDLGRPKGRWRFLGAVSVLGVVGFASYRTRHLEIIEI
ncbi:MAG: hypothetical protein ACKVS5_00635 [Parvularculaceae bacterium]